MEQTLPLNSSVLLTLGFYFLMMLYVIFSTILYFHWSQYSLEIKVTNLTLSLYALFTLPLVAIMGIVVLSF